MVKVFFLGATGHIGGEVLDVILKEFPDIEVTALVRSEDKGTRLRNRYRNVKTTIGDLDSLDVIEQASKDASIVINTAPDIPHAPTTHAITRGLSATTTTDRPPTYLIHTSGAAITWTHPANGTTSPSPTATWTDLPSARVLAAPPAAALHAAEDAAVRAAAPPGVNVAIVSPTVVYGLSRSGDHAVPVTLPTMVGAMERLGGGGGFAIGKGENRLGWVHVSDLAGVFAGLVGDAVEGLRRGGVGEESKPSLWGPEAYYFAADEEMSWREWMEMLAPEVGRHLGGGGGEKGDGVMREVGFEQVVKAIAGDGEPTIYDESQAVLFGTEMRCRSDRARKLLGWVPRGEGGLKAAVGETVDALFATRH